MAPNESQIHSRVVIRGNSVAAWGCLHLLRNAGFRPVLERTARPRLPAIMLSEAALGLIRDVFEKPSLLRSAHRITQRVVMWGPKSEPKPFAHSAVVVSELELLNKLELGVDAGEESTAGDFTI